MTKGVREDVSGFDLKPAKYLEPFIEDQREGFERDVMLLNMTFREVEEEDDIC